MATKSVNRTVNRNSVDGRFVTERYAEKHPRTTETERVKVPVPQSKSKK